MLKWVSIHASHRLARVVQQMHKHNVVISHRMLDGPMQIHFKRLTWHKRCPAVPHCFEADAIVEAGCLRERCSRHKLLHNLPRIDTHNMPKAHIVVNPLSKDHAGIIQHRKQHRKVHARRQNVSCVALEQHPLRWVAAPRLTVIRQRQHQRCPPLAQHRQQRALRIHCTAHLQRPLGRKVLDHCISVIRQRHQIALFICDNQLSHTCIHPAQLSVAAPMHPAQILLRTEKLRHLRLHIESDRSAQQHHRNPLQIAPGSQPLQHCSDAQTGERSNKRENADDARLMRPIAVASQQIRQHHHGNAAQHNERKAPAKVHHAHHQARHKTIKEQRGQQRLLDLVVLAVPNPAQRQPVFVQLIQHGARQSQLRIHGILRDAGLACPREKSCRIARIPNDLRHQQHKPTQPKGRQATPNLLVFPPARR